MREKQGWVAPRPIPADPAAWVRSLTKNLTRSICCRDDAPTNAATGPGPGILNTFHSVSRCLNVFHITPR